MKQTPYQILRRAHGIDLTKTPELLRTIAAELEEKIERLGAGADCSDPIKLSRDLVPWPEHAPLELELSGPDGDEKVEDIRVAGCIVSEWLKESLWAEAEDWVAERNREKMTGAQRAASALDDHQDFARATRNYSHES